MHKHSRKPVHSTEEKPVYPMRINKYLAHKNYTTRRQADHLIEKGYVTINGHVAVLGDKVNEGDMVEVDKTVMKKKQENYFYFVYHKPVGIVSHSPEKGQRGIEEIFHFRTRLFPIGRLDQDSHGLIILTNDGRITQKILNPQFAHEKEYIVETSKPITDDALSRMAGGMQLEDGTTRPCKVERVGPKKFRIILTEGKKRQIRRMCEMLRYTVVDLCRVRIMHIPLGDLKPGQYRRLTEEELRGLQI